MTELQFHPVADIFPMMSELEFSGLVDDIKLNGLREPVWLHRDGRIIDGRNRYRACVQIGIEPAISTYEGEDETLHKFVVSLNLHRRHLDETQRGFVGDRLAQYCADSQIQVTIPEAAELVSVGHSTIENARYVREHGTPELIAEAEKGRKNGGLSASAAAAAARLDAERQRQFLAQAEHERSARVAKQMRDDEIEARQMVARLHEPVPIPEPVPVPHGKFQCIVLDPPWPMEKIERKERPDQGVALDYAPMSVDQIGDEYWVPVRSKAADDCHIYLWVTHKYLPTGLALLNLWGFSYQCVMTWRKNVGITPYSWMYDTEHVLFARRGNLPLTQLGLRLSFDAKVQGHSIKPDVFYERVRAASPGPRLDMFPGVEHEGFEPWGLEASHRGNV